MKDLIVVLIAIFFFSLVAEGQNKNKMDDYEMRVEKSLILDNSYGDLLVQMKDGKMMMMKQGKMVLMENEMVMPTGVKVYPNGTVKLKNGETIIIKNGEMMNSSGAIMNNGKTKIKKE